MIQISDWLPPRPTFENFFGLCVALTLFSGAAEMLLYLSLGIRPVLGGPLMALAVTVGVFAAFKFAASFPLSPSIFVPLGFWSALAVWIAIAAIWSTSPGIVTGKLLLFFGVSLSFLVLGICIGFSEAAFAGLERSLFALGLATAAAVFLFANRDISKLNVSDAAQALSTFKDAYQAVTLCVSLAALVAFVHMLAGTHSRLRSLAWGAAWIFLTAGALAGGGRGAAIGGMLAQFAVLVFAMIKFRRERGSARLLGVLLVAPILAVAVLAAGSLLELRGVERLLDIVNSTTDKTGRLALWSAAMKMADAHPMLGAGFASFHGSANNLQESGLYPHNVFLELLAENGVIGFGLFIAALASAIVAAARRAGSLPFIDAAIWLGFLVCTLFQMNVSGTITGREISFALGLSVGLTARSFLRCPAQHAPLSQAPQTQA